MSVAEDALAIANLKASYCRAADAAAGDPAAARAMLADVFTPDVAADYGYGLLDGPAAVADFLCTAIAGGSVWMVHMLHSPRIVVDGDAATGEWTVLVYSRRRGDDGAGARPVIGRYSDGFVRTTAGWRIARVEFRQPE